MKIANACAKEGAIRPGESIGTPSDSVRYKAIIPESIDIGLPFEVTNWIEPI